MPSRSHPWDDAARPATLLDVARDAGVSRATASRVLSGSSNVSPSARERVLRSAGRLHYRVNSAARSLRTSRSGLVGLLIPGFHNDLYGPLADRLDRRLRDHGLSVVIGSSGWTSDGDVRVLESFTDRQMDAIVMSPRSDRSAGLGDALAQVTCPIVLLDRDIPGLVRDTVVTDLRSGVTDALGALAALGHLRIAVGAYGVDLRPGREVRAAFADAASRWGLSTDPHLVVDMHDIDGEAGEDIADALLAADPTAVVIGGPTTLLARCLRRLRDRLGGDPFPGRLSVVIVGNEALAEVHEPALAVVRRSAVDIADAVADQLLRRLDEPGGEAITTSLPLTFRAGPSIGPPAQPL